MSTPVNGIYVLQGIVPSQIAAAPVGAKVVDLYDDSGNLFSTSQVAQMESGGGQALGYFSIGEAENYRPYWSSLPSSILGPQDPSWPGDYQVAYWTPQWLTVSENYIQTMINQGYNGAYFDVVDEAEQSWAVSNVPGGTLAAAEGAMVTLVQELANYAHAKDPNFKIWINSSGAEDMLANSALVKTIDGVYEEQLFYQSATQATNPADLSYNLAYLDNVVNAGKPVVAIEYVSGASEVSSVESQAKADGLGYYIANPDLALNGVDTQGFTTTVAAPAVTISSTGGTVTSATQTITGTVDVADAGSTVTVLDGATSIGTARVGSAGAWSATVTLTGQGANVLTATDTNSTGTGISNPVTYTLQTATAAAPTVKITSAGGTTSSAAQTITGTVADAGSTVTILDGTTQIGSATVAATGGWSAAVTLANQGANVLTATDANAAGTGTSNAVTYTLNTAAPTAPTVEITSAGGTVASAAQTIAGTVDVADADSTVTILDGTTQIGSATVAANGGWSANVTLPAQGANVLTATDANAAGTGTSNAVTYTLQTAAAPTPPTLTIADPTLSVTGGGGTVSMGVSVTAPDSSTATTVTITGLPRYERITDNFDSNRFRGSSITLSEAEVNSGLTLTSRYWGSGDPSATLTITASDTIGGVTSVSAPQTITVTDPPSSASGSSVDALAKVLSSFQSGPETGSGLARNGSGAGLNSLSPASLGLAAVLANANNSGAFDASSSYGGGGNHWAPIVAASSEIRVDNLGSHPLIDPSISHN